MLANIEVKTITPVHIGDDDNRTLSSLSDFIVENNYIKVVQQNKLEKLFSLDENLMEDYLKQIKQHKGKKFSLKKFLKNNDVLPGDICQNRKIDIIGNFNGKEIYPFISENGKNYIPGTTLKGAIRNSFAFAYINKHKEIKKRILQKTYKNKSKINFNNEEKIIFGRSATNDILKLLQVTDSNPFKNNSTAIYSCNKYHLIKNNVSIPINYECLSPNSLTKFRIKIDNNFNIDNLNIDDKEFWNNNLKLEQVFENINRFSLRFITREIIELENIKEMESSINFYKKLKKDIQNCNNKTCYISIGKGNTILSKTILLSLTRKELSLLRYKLRGTKVSRNFGWIRGNRNKKRVSDSKLPVTRLVYNINNNSLQTGFGWIKMEL